MNPQITRLVLIALGMIPSMALGQEAVEPPPFSKSAAGFNLQLTPSEWRTAGDVRGAGVASLQTDVIKAWPVEKPAPAGTLTFGNGAVLVGRIGDIPGPIVNAGPIVRLVPATQPRLEDGLDAEPLSRVSQRLMNARIATAAARSTYGQGHSAIAAAEKAEQDLQRYYDQATKDLPPNMKAELAAQELAQISRAHVEAQLARLEAEALYGPEHATLVRLRKQEASVQELHRETIERVRTMHDLAQKALPQR